VTQRELIEKLFGRPIPGGGYSMPSPLPRQSVEHDSVDKMVFGNYADDSPRFRRLAVDEAPQIAPDVPDPDPIDFTAASPEDIKAWQAEAKKAKAARESAPPYDAWENLTRDIFYSYHHAREPEVLEPGEVDPAVSHHSKIVHKMMAEDDHAQSRNLTRDKPTPAAIATMAATRALKEALENELIDQARHSEEFEQERGEAENAISELESLREQAREHHAQGTPVPGSLVERIKGAVQTKRQAVGKAIARAQQQVPFSAAAAEAVRQAVQAGADAAKAAGNIPSFGAGFGEGEPRYESPEQALTIADMWANNETLRRVSELYGRLDQDMRFKRAKRVVGGQDEIVDLKLGDDIRRIVASELVMLADEDYEDDFFMRLVGGELMVYDTVGEEHAGRGPVVLVVDESGSMSGERNVWAKAMAMCLLNICRREKRDFAYVGFSSGRQVHTFLFKAKEQLDAQAIIDCAAHFFGGGTTPVIGMAAAEAVMTGADEFRKADVVFVSDGDASWGNEDKRLRDTMAARGVRFHGIGIGSDDFRYLYELTDDVVSIHDFELENPSEATAHLATHIT
jgi:uncharacterized protein with von Willebrand factor type A (vWA) domain